MDSIAVPTTFQTFDYKAEGMVRLQEIRSQGDVMNTSGTKKTYSRNYRTVVCETCWHMPALQYQASTPLGSVITPHNQPCQYHEHNIEGHCYPKVVTLT